MLGRTQEHNLFQVLMDAPVPKPPYSRRNALCSSAILRSASFIRARRVPAQQTTAVLNIFEQNLIFQFSNCVNERVRWNVTVAMVKHSLVRVWDLVGGVRGEIKLEV